MQRLGIYIHWPFCKSKCPYCDFFSRVKKDINQEELISSYLSDLEYYRSLNDNYIVESIFFGGGTPSLIEPQYIEKIIDKTASLWKCKDNLEISLEANPNTDNGNLFADLKQAGINRLSLGVQALNEKDLKFLGRTHSLSQAYKSIDSVLQNFDNHSMDLIYARPNQKPQEWEKELQNACSLGLKHLSLYQLTIEENTFFARKGIKPANDDVAEELYKLSDKIIKTFGYSRYEVSNYAQNGFECHHNLGYWEGFDYVGIGNGGIGRIHIANDVYNTFYPRKQEIITKTERAEELLIMGLRMTKGINKNLFTELCGIGLDKIIDKQSLNNLKKDEYIEEDDNNIRVTEKGNFVLNYIINKLVGL